MNEELEEERRKIMEEREKWEKEKSEIQTRRNEEEFQRAMAAVDNNILDLLPKTKEVASHYLLSSSGDLTICTG